MRAAQVVALDGPDGVRVGEIGPAPVAGEDEVLIEVHSVGLSYPDLLMSEGRYQIKPEVPFVLGVDFAGVVSQDAAALGFTAGDRVAGWSAYGSAAEVVAVPSERVFPLPQSLNFNQGAAMPLNYLTDISLWPCGRGSARGPSSSSTARPAVSGPPPCRSPPVSAAG